MAKRNQKIVFLHKTVNYGHFSCSKLRDNMIQQRLGWRLPIRSYDFIYKIKKISEKTSVTPKVAKDQLTLHEM